MGKEKRKRKSKKREDSPVLRTCLSGPPRLELWAIALGFIILLFFIEIVSRLESEWKEKWANLEGMLDPATSTSQADFPSNPKFPDLRDNNYNNYDSQSMMQFDPIKVTPDFDPILDKLVSHSPPSNNPSSYMFVGGDARVFLFMARCGESGQ